MNRLEFLVQIKSGKDVLFEFGDTGSDSVTVAHRNQRLCGPGQYVRCVANKVGEPFEVKADRQALECAKLREAAERLADLPLAVQLSGFIGGLPA